ncbi:MAG TPA: tetratricopeptide repeat protein [Pyrinomonadaceae bacterium]|nr:tetratricopeptide repeat protein [Pyrinomonadaceae bacterium]
MSKWNRIGAAALSAALLFAPLTAFAAPARALAAQRQDDTPTDAEQAVFNRGRDLFSKGQYEQAAAVFRDFLKSNPDSYVADLMLLWLGRSYIELGKLREAEEVAQRLRAMQDTPFADIYQSELENAQREAATRPAPAARPTPTPRPVEVARATPTPAPARNNANTRPPANTNLPQSREIARAATNTNSNTPTLTIRGGGDATRPRNAGRQSRRATQPATTAATPVATPTPRPVEVARATPTPAPSRRETAASTAAAARPSPPPTPTPTPVRVAEVREQPSAMTAVTSAGPDTTQPQGGFSITVKQVPNLQLALRRAALAAQPGQAIQLPLIITNTGNKEDQFRLETDLPAEYQPTFSQSGAGTDMPIFVTPQMARGANLEVTLNLRVPDNAPDNQQQRFLVRASSQADSTVAKVSDASLTVVAAALAAASNALQESVMPGDTFTQRISVRNQGSATARGTRADFVFNQDFELVSATPAPINYDRPSRTAIWSLGELDSRDNREITVTLRAVPEALAGPNKPVGRGTMRTQSLVIPSNFDGPTISVGRVARAQVDSVSSGLTATPGDTIFVPFIVRNPSNYPEAFEMRITAPGAPPATVYADLNGDGRHQDGEPAVTQTSSLDPRGGQFPVLLRVDIPRSTPDGQQFAYNLVTRALSATGRVASEANTVLRVATPRVRVRAELGNSQPAPGETIFYRLVLVNDGGGLARNLAVTEYLPDALEFVSSSPELSLQDMPGGARGFVWRLNELAPGDTAVLLVTVRLRQNLPADAVITPRHTLTFQDSNGNGYHGQ